MENSKKELGLFSTVNSIYGEREREERELGLRKREIGTERERRRRKGGWKTKKEQGEDISDRAIARIFCPRYISMSLL